MTNKKIVQGALVPSLVRTTELEVSNLTDPLAISPQLKANVGQILDTNMENLGDITNEPTGVFDRTEFTLSWTDSAPDRTLTLTPVSGSFDIYQKGVKTEIVGIDTQQITDVEGLHAFYYDSGVLISLANPTDAQFDDIVLNKVFISLVYWDATNKLGKPYIETHGITMDGQTHLRLHQDPGAIYVNGLALGDFIVDASGALDSHAQFSIASGEIKDEDIPLPLISIASTVGGEVFYLDGSNWRWQTNAGFSVLTTGTGRLAYNNSGTQAEVPNNALVCAHMFAINSLDQKCIPIQGQTFYNNIVAAREGAITEIKTLQLAGLPSKEFKAIGTVIFQTSDSYTNAVKARIRSTDLGDDYVDFRNTAISSGSPAGDHGTLAGLNNNDHLQYLMRSGKVFTVSSTGNPTPGDYATIQAALDDNVTEGILILVGPGTYTNDTIFFTANNQTVMGASDYYDNSIITSPNSLIVDSKAFVNCTTARLYLNNSNITILSNMVENVAGQLNFYNCHLNMTINYNTTGTQPAMFIGGGTVNIYGGLITYDHQGTLNTTTDVKAPFNLSIGGIYMIERAKINVIGNNPSFGITVGNGLSGEIHADRCIITVNDPISNNVAGILIAGTGTYDFHYNDIQITSASTNTSVGLWITGSPTVNGKHNNLTVINTGGAGLEYGIVMTGGTVSSCLSVINAKDGNNIVGGSLTTTSLKNNFMVTSETTFTEDQSLVTKKWVEDHVVGSTYWDRTGTTLSPETSGDNVEVDSNFLIERPNLNDDCYYYAKNTNAGINQEWAWGLQGNNGQWSLRDVTNSDFLVFSFAPGAPINSIRVTSDGFIGLGTGTFQAADKLHIQHSTTSLFKMKTSGLMTSQISNYDTLVSTASQDFVTAKWTEDLIDTEITANVHWERTNGVITPITTTDVVSVDRIRITYDSNFYLDKLTDDPVFSVDSNDYFLFDRSENSYNWYVDGNLITNAVRTSTQSRFDIKRLQGASDEAVLGLFCNSAGTNVIEFDVDGGSGGEIAVSGAYMSFAAEGESFTSNEIFRMDTQNRGIIKHISRAQEITVPSGSTNYDSLDASAYNVFVFDTTSGGTANIRGFINAVSSNTKTAQTVIYILKIQTAGSGSVVLKNNSGINQEILCRGNADVTLGTGDFGAVTLVAYDIGSGVNMYTSY
jgi:hypothetical protein